jgi:hypothetical protein
MKQSIGCTGTGRVFASSDKLLCGECGSSEYEHCERRPVERVTPQQFFGLQEYLRNPVMRESFTIVNNDVVSYGD